MAATQIGVVYDSVTDIVRIIRLPDTDSELDDPALNYPGCTKVKVMRADYDALQNVPITRSDFASVIIPGSAVVTVAVLDVGV